MSIQEAQVPLPAPPTGVALIIAEHEYNPENGHYEPSIRGVPLNVNAVAPAVAGAFLAVVANAPVLFYHFVFANPIAAVETITLTEPGGNTYIVEVPANNTVTLVSTPDAPLFVSRVAGNFTILGSSGAGTQVTAAYVVK